MTFDYIYIASPYTHELEAIRRWRYRAVQHYCTVLFRRGLPCFSPIVHWHPTAIDFDLPHDYKAFWDLNFPFLLKAKMLYVLELPDWEQSYGVAKEIEYANHHRIPVEYIPYPWPSE